MSIAPPGHGFSISQPFDFDISSDIGSVTLPEGFTGYWAPTITASSRSGAPQPVTLRIGLASGGGANPPRPTFYDLSKSAELGDAIQDTPTFWANVHITVQKDTTPGAYTFRVTGDGGGVTKTLDLVMVVSGPSAPAPTPAPVPSPAAPAQPPSPAALQLGPGEKYSSLTYQGKLTLNVEGRATEAGRLGEPGAPLGTLGTHTSMFTFTGTFGMTLNERRGLSDLHGDVLALGGYSGSFTNDAWGCETSGSMSGTVSHKGFADYSSQSKTVGIWSGLFTYVDAQWSESPPWDNFCNATVGNGFFGSALGDAGRTSDIWTFPVEGGSKAFNGESVLPDRAKYSGTIELTLVNATKELPFDYEVAVKPKSAIIVQKDTALFGVRTTLTRGEPETVAMELTTDPRLRASFAPASGLPTFGSQLAIGTSCDTPPTVYYPQVIGRSARYLFTRGDVATLRVDPNPKCAQTSGAVTPLKTNAGSGWTTGKNGFVRQPLGAKSRLTVGPNSRVVLGRKARNINERGEIIVYKGKTHLSWQAEPAAPPAGYAIPPSQIGPGGQPIGGIGITVGSAFKAVVKGTSVFLDVAQNGTAILTVAEGSVDVSSVKEPKKSVTVSAGKQLMMRTGAALAEPKPFDPGQFQLDTKWPPEAPAQWWRSAP